MFPSGTKTSRPEELKVMGTESKKVPSEPLGVTVSGTFLFLPFDSCTHEFPLEENTLHKRDAESKHTPLWRTLAQPFRLLHLIDFVVVSSKGHSICLSGQLLQDRGPTITLLWLGSTFLGQKQYCVEFHGG